MDILSELQLQYQNMMVAKKNGHIITWRPSETEAILTKAFTITNTEVLAKISRNMSEKWFTFMNTRVPKARDDLPGSSTARWPLKSESRKRANSLQVGLEEITILSRVSLYIYEQGDNLRKLYWK